VFVEAQCPRIEVLPTVAKVEGNITNGMIGGEQLDALLKGTSALRASETYYRKQLEVYNSKFTNTLTIDK